jgi:hypothetical protein
MLIGLFMPAARTCNFARYEPHSRVAPSAEGYSMTTKDEILKVADALETSANWVLRGNPTPGQRYLTGIDMESAARFIRAEAPTRAALDRLQHIGDQMANVLYNWAQESNPIGVHLDDAGRAKLKAIQGQWDEATRDLRATNSGDLRPSVQ